MARQQILAALREQPCGRPDALAAFSNAALRRLPDDELRALDPTEMARRLADAFTTIDRRGAEDVVVAIRRPRTGMEGGPAEAVVLEIATEDRPFLLSTVVDELERRGHRVVRSFHPIVGVVRDEEQRIGEIVPARTARQREALLHLEIEGELRPEDDDELASAVRLLIRDVLRVTDHHDAMRHRLRRLVAELQRRAADRGGEDDAARAPEDDPEEVAALIEWLLDDNLVLLGVREDRIRPKEEEPLTPVEGSGLGLLAGSTTPTDADGAIDDPAAEEGLLLEGASLFTATRTASLSPVQRRVRMEDLNIVLSGTDGETGVRTRVLGLFTRRAYAQPAAETPMLRRKLATVLEREDVVLGSHDEVTLLSLFQALPKDELFHASIDELHRTLVALLHAEEHRETRTMVRVDRPTSTVSVVVAIPRDRYSPQLREQLQDLFRRRFGARRIEVEVALGDRREALARFLLQLDGPVPEVSVAELQAEVRTLSRSWHDTLATNLRGSFGPDAARLRSQVGERLPRAYQDAVEPAEAIEDVVLLDRLLDGDANLLVALRPDPHGSSGVRLRAVQRGEPLELSSFLPILESLGLTVIEEIPYRLEGPPPRVQLHDFGVRGSEIDPETDGERVADAVLAAARGHFEIDTMNVLVLEAGLAWREVALLRAYRRMRRQFGTAFTPSYVDATLAAHPDVVRALLTYFRSRFAPGVEEREARSQAARQEVVGALEGVSRLDHHRILRGFLELIDATVRTNAFRSDAISDHSGEPYLSFKLETAKIAEAPSPVPFREIFVHSPRVEGVHLRAGPVARGGLRWSDRRDDVRSEVLDLVKAQVLKNAVIVPTGAKGGFVVKHEPDDPGSLRDEVRNQYITFVRGLLDLTDDLEGDRVVPPQDVVRYDGDDPYLVVAADRGTASFSDTANDLAARYGYWLGDAFASGGSAGYDHKALAVTATGAWLTVRRRFRELGVDVQREPITMVGIGDMSGDVFGNGLLQSRAVKLVAAFDHRDVFVDPDPDPEVAFEERRRLFDLPRSTWQDYDRSLISPGGGVFPRASRRIPLSDEVRRLLRLDADELSPPELIRALLCAPVDLLFAGGIGTYVKGSTEPEDEIGDRANQDVRVVAADLRARVIGEGANLAVTQRGRLEYARRGGLVNQDAIDNAGGVITSDREVNLKILLSLAQDAGALAPEDRNEVLQELTPEVVATVMRDVDLQAAALSREVASSGARIDDHALLLMRLEDVHGLDREAELLPPDEELRRRAERGGGLTRPELATELAWAKRDVKEILLEDGEEDDEGIWSAPALTTAAEAMFPPSAVARFGGFLPQHRLRRELIATAIANDVVDRMGPTFVRSVAHHSGYPPMRVVLAYRAAREVVDAPQRWQQLEAHEASHDPERLLELTVSLQQLLHALTVTILSEPGTGDLVAPDPRMSQVAKTLIGEMLQLGSVDQRRARIAHARWLVDDLVDPDLARFIACASDLAMLPDVTAVLEAVGDSETPVTVADAFLRLAEATGIDRLEAVLRKEPAGGGWRRRQHHGLAADLRRGRREAALSALTSPRGGNDEDAVEAFLASRPRTLSRIREVIDAAERAEDGRLEAIAVAVRAVREGVQSDPQSWKAAP